MKLLIEHLSRLLEQSGLRERRIAGQLRLAEERADRQEERAAKLEKQVSQLLDSLNSSNKLIEALKATITNLTNQLTADRSVRKKSADDDHWPAC